MRKEELIHMEERGDKYQEIEVKVIVIKHLFWL